MYLTLLNQLSVPSFGSFAMKPRMAGGVQMPDLISRTRRACPLVTITAAFSAYKRWKQRSFDQESANASLLKTAHGFAKTTTQDVTWVAALHRGLSYRAKATSAQSAARDLRDPPPARHLYGVITEAAELTSNAARPIRWWRGQTLLGDHRAHFRHGVDDLAP